MDIKSTMDKIRSGLTGDLDKDMEYLAEQQKKYLLEENNEMLQREILQMMYQIIPEKDRAAFEQAVNDILEKQDAKITECDKLFEDGQYEKSLKLADELIEQMHEIVSVDPEEGFFSFNSEFEYLLYKNKISCKAIYYGSLPVSEFYLRKANILYFMERYMEAREMIADALRWNPVNADSYLDDADCLFEVGDIDEAWAQIRKGYTFAYTLEMVSRSYSNAAKLLIFDDDKKKDAAALFWAAVRFSDEDEVHDSCLSFIEELGFSVDHEPDWKKVAKTCEKYGLHFGADESIIELAVKSAESAAEQGAIDDALYYYGIAYDFTGDEKTAKIMQDLESKPGK